MKRLAKMVCFILSVALILNVIFIPTKTIYAQKNDQTQQSSEVLQTPSIALDALVDENGYLTDEALSNLDMLPYEEDKFIEVTDNGDGTKRLRLYSSPIKYENSEGIYEYIDNTIKVNDPNENSQHKYQNKASDVNVLLAENLDQSNAIEMVFEGYSIGFKPICQKNNSNGKKVGIYYVDRDKNNRKSETFDSSTTYESLEYAGTFNDLTNIRITPTSSGFKEDIIFRKVPKETEFSYELTVENAVPVLREDGNLYFIDLEKCLIVASVAAPFMYDSSVECHESYDVQVKLEKEADNKYIYTLIPGRDFLEDDNTVYPVVLDPSCQTSTVDVQDTYITSKYPGSNYYSNTQVKVGFCPDLSVVRGLIKIRYWPSVLAGCKITSAYYYGYQNYTGASNPLMDIVACDTYYDPMAVTWYSKPTLGAIYSQKYVQADGWHAWDVSTLVMGWHTGDITNYGMCLKNNNETVNIYKRFYSTNSTVYPNFFDIWFVDSTPPPIPTIFTPTASFSGPTGNITLSWSAVTDLPATGYATGLSHYNLKRFIGTTPAGEVTVYSPNCSRQFPDCLDNTNYRFELCAVDYAGNASAPAETTYTTPDKTGPTAPTSFTVNPPGWTKSVTPVFSWNGITDEGGHQSYSQYQIDGGAWTNIGTGNGVVAGSFTLNAANLGLSEGAHTISLRCVDTAGNIGAPASCTYYKDTTKPSATLSVSDMTPNGIVYVSANIASSGGSNFSDWILDYGPGNPASSFPTVLKTGTTTVSNKVICEWDTSSLVENTYYTLRLQAKDAAGNVLPVTLVLLKASGSVSVSAGLQIDQPLGYNADGYQPDIAGADQYMLNTPSVAVTYQKINNGGIAGLLPGKLYINNKLFATETAAGTGFSFNAAAYNNGWVYPEGSVVFMYTQAKDATAGELYSTSTLAALAISDPFDNTTKIMNLSSVVQNGSVIELAKTSGVYNAQGSFESTNQAFAGDVSYIDLTVDQTVPATASVTYEISVDNGTVWQPITPVSTDGGFTVNAANRLYFTTNPVGNSVKVRATLKKATTADLSPAINSWSVDVRYTTYANVLLIDNTFPKDARGMTNLLQTQHNETNGSIVLGSGFTTGSVQSTVRNTSNDTIEACLEVEQNIPTGTSIKYYISTQAGAAGTWQQVVPGQLSNLNSWFVITSPGKQVVIKAELTGSGTVTPQLLSWKLDIKEKIAGRPHMIKLVDEPWNLSTLTGANYMTLLRWEKSTSEGVTYNIYRSTTPYFVPSTATLAISGLTENSWNDYNLNYGQTFYYQVTAVKMINGYARESLPSNQAWATVVSAGEVNKRLGLQNYWSFSGFITNSGTGYVNVSNGNLAYITTDMVLSDPFFATVMKRTFNSMANTKTAMGYGWDFSFNTCLLKEYSGTTEVAMILKDGDGSFHRFPKSGSTYTAAKGTFMSLTYNATLNEYQILRKDNIVYHYDAKSMKLKSFTDSNGNALLFTYNERGNLREVSNTIGEKMILEYYVEGAAPNGSDYTYVNYKPDMLKTVTWTENTATAPVSTVYNYEYYSSDRLKRAYTTIENNTVYEEVFTYDAASKLTSISDPLDKLTNIAYEASGRIYRITDASNEYYDFAYTLDANSIPVSTSIKNKYGVGVKYTYNADGLVTQKTDALNQNINYTFNSNFQVMGMNYQNTVNGGTTPVTISTSITYTADGKGNMQSVTGPDGTLTTYGTYNSFNKPLSVSVTKDGKTLITTFTYDSSGNLLTTKDPELKVTTNTYETVNGHNGYLTAVTNNFGGRTKYIYDSKGRLTKTQAYINGTYQYDTATYAYEYDADGCFMRVNATDAMGNLTKTYYDRLGRTVKVINADGLYATASYDLAGNVKTQTDRAGNSVSYLYDNLNRLTSATYPDASTNSIAYLKWDSTTSISGNDADKVVKTDGTGVKTTEYYDIAGRLLKTSISDATTEIIAAQYEYDLIGNCTKVTDNAGRVSTAQYNTIGQTTKTIMDPVTTANPSGKSIQTSYVYDMIGNQLSVTDGEGFTTSFTYDNDARLKTVSQTVGTNTLSTSYAYDIAEGGYIKNRVTDAKGYVKEAWFDVLGRKKYDYNIGNPADSTVMQTGYDYNNNGQVTLVTRNDSTKEKYTYNCLGQVVRIDYYEAVANTSVNSVDYITYDYVANGNVHISSVYHGASEETTVNTYDNMGRVQQMRQGDIANGALSIDYTYDLAGKVKTISYAKGATTNTLTYNYDTLGRISNIQYKNGTAANMEVRRYNYLANGDLDYTADYYNFATNDQDYKSTKYNYNSVGQISRLLTTNVDRNAAYNVLNTTNTEDYTMTYDKRGNIKTEIATTNYGTAQTVNKTYDYDAIGRLTKAVIGSETSNYTYDNVGNRLSMSDGTGTYGYLYSQFNQLTDITKNGSAYTSYTYDARGNQTTETTKYLNVTVDGTTTTYNKTTAYGYDLANQLSLLSISTPTANAQGTVSYSTDSTRNTYNAAGQRVKKWENAGTATETTKYFYTGSATLYTTDENNTMLTENILDLGGGIVASKRFANTVNDPTNIYTNKYFFYNYDVRGSTTSVIAPDGTLTTGYSYDEFGAQTRTGATNFLNEVTFTGSVSDKSSGLQYLNARFYNPGTGRFLSQDTYSGNAYDPWTQHLYSYCGNNPVNMVDPTGHRPIVDDEHWASPDGKVHNIRSHSVTGSSGTNESIPTTNESVPTPNVSIPTTNVSIPTTTASAENANSSITDGTGNFTIETNVDAYVEFKGEGYWTSYINPTLKGRLTYMAKCMGYGQNGREKLMIGYGLRTHSQYERAGTSWHEVGLAVDLLNAEWGKENAINFHNGNTTVSHNCVNEYDSILAEYGLALYGTSQGACEGTRESWHVSIIIQDEANISMWVDGPGGNFDRQDYANTYAQYSYPYGNGTITQDWGRTH